METKPKRKKKKLPSSPVSGLTAGLGAGSLLGLGLAGQLGSTREFNELHSALRNNDAPLQPGETALTRYENTMAHGARLRPFGIPVGDMLAAVRSSPKAMELAGTPGYVAATPGEYEEARAHYGQFAKGPIAAYGHQLDAKGRGTPSLGGKDYADLMLPEFQKFVRSRFPGSSWLQPHEIDTKSMPLEKQVQTMKDFHSQLSPELQAERQRVETNEWGPNLKNNVKNYSLPMRAGMGLHTALQAGGSMAGGAALGGLLGNLGHRLFGDKDDEEGRGRATMLGTGLGGLAGGAGYALMNPRAPDLATRAGRAIGNAATKATKQVGNFLGGALGRLKAGATIKAMPGYRVRETPAGIAEHMLSSSPGEAPVLEEEQQIVEPMSTAEPERLGNTLVRLGYDDPRENFGRVWRNPHLGPMGRTLGLLTHIPGAISGGPPAQDYERIGPYYNRAADVAVQPWNAPAATMHELGHAIDLNSTVPKNWLMRQVKGTGNDLKSMFKPTLSKEHAAWNKGRKAYLEGAAEEGRPVEEVKKHMGNSGWASPPALGSYWGAGLGTLGGLAGGIALASHLRQTDNHPAIRRIPLYGSLMGGALGGLTGLGLGSLLRRSGKEKQERYVDRKYRPKPKADKSESHDQSGQSAESGKSRTA